MDPIIGGALISGAASLLGGGIGFMGAQSTNAQNAAMMMQQEQFNAQQAQVQRDWQERMANTAYQRAMSDMKTAGLNPILAANLGGAVTPGGGVASAGSIAPMQNPGMALQSGITSAGEAARQTPIMKAAAAQADKDASQTDVNKATEKLTNASTSKVAQDERTARSAEKLNDAATANKAVEAVLTMANANSANATARVNTRIAEDTERFGDSQWSKAIGGIVRMLGTARKEVPFSARSVADPSPPAVGRGNPTYLDLGGPPPPPVFQKRKY